MIKRRYNTPPIQEAIFEAKFTYDNFDLAIPGQLYEVLKEIYSIKEDIKHIQILPSYILNKDTAPLIQAPLMRARKEDNSELVQFGPGIVIANILKYISWDSFLSTINKISTNYIEIAKPQYVDRVATRYINNIHIPEENINITDYFNLGIQLPKSLANIDLRAFELTFVNEIINTNKFTIKTRFLTEALKPGEIGNRFILDIDCFTSQLFEPDIDQIILLATQAHDTLEMFFESIITDKTRSLIEEIKND